MFLLMQEYKLEMHCPFEKVEMVVQIIKKTNLKTKERRERMNKIETYYIYMVELKLNNNYKDDEPHFYIGKTHNITQRLMNHIASNNKSTKLIEKGNAKVVAICEIQKIVFDESEIKLLKSKKEKESDKLADSITSKIENKFVHEKIHEKGTDIKKNKEIYRGGHYTQEWGDSNYIFKRYEEYVKYFECKKGVMCKKYKLDIVLDERYPIKDCLHEKTNDPEKLKYQEEYKQEIRSYIEEIVKE